MQYKRNSTTEHHFSYKTNKNIADFLESNYIILIIIKTKVSFYSYAIALKFNQLTNDRCATIIVA